MIDVQEQSTITTPIAAKSKRGRKTGFRPTKHDKPLGRKIGSKTVNKTKKLGRPLKPVKNPKIKRVETDEEKKIRFEKLYNYYKNKYEMLAFERHSM